MPVKLDPGDGKQLMAQITIKVWSDGAMSIEGPTTEPEWCLAALDHAAEALRNQIRPKDQIVIPGYDTSIEKVKNLAPSLPDGKPFRRAL